MIGKKNKRKEKEIRDPVVEKRREKELKAGQEGKEFKQRREKAFVKARRKSGDARLLVAGWYGEEQGQDEFWVLPSEQERNLIITSAEHST